MAIIWGGFTNHLRIGIDCWTDGYDTWTPSINVYVDVYVQCDSSFNFNDSQTAVLSGSTGGSWTFQNTLQANQSVFVGRAIIGGQSQSYGGGPTYNLSAVLNGVYLGAGPSVSRSFSLPPRPIRAPSGQPAPSVSGVTATHADFGWGFPADQGGSGVDYTWLQIGTTNFGSLVYDNQSPGWVGRNLDIFAPNTTYYCRVASHNAAGWSAFSGVTPFTTLPFQVGKPTLPGIEPDKATVAWTAPAGGTATGYQLQYATAPDFSNAQTITAAVWGTSREVTGLTPATTYFFRVRAKTANGYGVYSPAVSGQTLSGAKVRQGGAWVNAVAYVRSGGGWQLAKVYKRANGNWVL